MELNIFSYIYLPFGYSLLGNTFSSVLPIFLLNFERLCSGYKLFVSYICCKYFLTFVTYIFTLSETGRIQDGKIVCVIHFL